MNKIKSIPNFFRRKYLSNDILKIEWAIIGVSFVLSLVCFMYVDTTSITSWSVSFIDSLFSGKPLDFYLKAHENSQDIVHKYVGSDFLAYAILGIWNIPLWILQNFFGKNIVLSPILLTWSKLFFFIVFFMSMYITYKMTINITQDKKKSLWTVFLSCSSIVVVMMSFGQNDIFFIFFSLVAVYYLLKEKFVIFYLFSALSVAIKPYFIFAFVAIILIYEKNIIKASVKIFSGFSILFITKLIYRNAPLYRESIKYGPIESELENLLSPSINLGPKQASLFIIALALLYFYCYFFSKKNDEKEKKHYLIIYAIASVYIICNIFSYQLFYRYMLIIPYLYILFVLNSKYMRVNIILETIFTLFLTFSELFRGTYFIASKFVGQSLFARLIGTVDESRIAYNSVGNLLSDKFSVFPLFQNAYTGLFFISGILILIINFPQLKTKRELVCEKGDRFIIWIRLFIPIFYMVVVVLCYYKLKVV